MSQRSSIRCARKGVLADDGGIGSCPEKCAPSRCLSPVGAHPPKNLVGAYLALGPTSVSLLDGYPQKDLSKLEVTVPAWEPIASQVVQGLRAGQLPPAPLINDTATHEQDVRSLAGIPGGTDSPGFEYARSTFLSRFGDRVDEAGIERLRIETEGWVDTAGSRGRRTKVEGTGIRGRAGNCRSSQCQPDTCIRMEQRPRSLYAADACLQDPGERRGRGHAHLLKSAYSVWARPSV